MYIAKLLFVAFAASCAAYSVQDSKLNLVVYYESLCLLSQEFVYLELVPTYEKLGDVFSFELVPYQKINNSDSSHFQCIHGPKACVLNKHQACASYLKPSEKQIINFVKCDIQDATRSDTDEKIQARVKKCAEDNGISFDDLNACLSSSVGDDLLTAYSERIEKLDPRLPHVPNIRFNGVYDRAIESRSIDDLTGVICDLLGDNKPEACNN